MLFAINLPTSVSRRSEFKHVLLCLHVKFYYLQPITTAEKNGSDPSAASAAILVTSAVYSSIAESSPPRHRSGGGLRSGGRRSSDAGRSFWESCLRCARLYLA